MARKKAVPQMIEPEVVLPSLYLHDSTIPKRLKDAKVKQKVKMEIVASVASRSESDGKYGSSRSISLEIHKIKPIERKKPVPKPATPKRKK